MKSIGLAFFILITCSLSAQTRDQDIRGFVSAKDYEKIDYWWKERDLSSLENYVKLLSAQDTSDKAVALAIKTDLLIERSTLTTELLGKIQKDFDSVLSQMDRETDRNILVIWMNETGLNSIKSENTSETELRSFQEKYKETISFSGRHPSVKLSQMYEKAKHSISDTITGAWRNSDSALLMNISQERLKKNENDLIGMAIKLDYLVYMSLRVTDSDEIERLISKIKMHPIAQGDDQSGATVRHWLGLCLSAYSEILQVLRSGNTEEIERLRRSFSDAKRNGSLPSAELVRRLEISESEAVLNSF